MKFLDKVFGKIETDDDLEEYEELEQTSQQKSQPTQQKPQQNPQPQKPHEIATDRIKTIQQEENMNRNRTNNETTTHGSNVVNFRPSQSHDNAPAERVRVIVIEPKNMDDAQQAANYLDEKRPVIINFEKTPSDEARRILDFISGTIYAIRGEITNIGENVFLCAPNNVSVSLADNDKRIGDVNWIGGTKSNG